MGSSEISVKDLLEQKIGTDGAKQVIDKMQAARDNGTQGDALYGVLEDALKTQGYTLSRDDSGILDGFFIT